MINNEKNAKKLIIGLKLFALVLSFFAFVCIIPLIISPKNFHFLREYFNRNSITLLISEELDRKKVDIFWIPKAGTPEKIISHGSETKTLFKEDGINRFFVTYDKDTIGGFSYFKSKYWHGHQHLIKIKKNELGTVILDVELFGPDKQHLSVLPPHYKY